MGGEPGGPGGKAPRFRPWRKRVSGGLAPRFRPWRTKGVRGACPPGLGHGVQRGVRGACPRFRPRRTRV